MRYSIILSCLLIIFSNLNSQNSYYLKLKPKDIFKTRLALSHDAIERKKNYNIPIDSKDYAIENSIIDTLRLFDTKLKISNWLNAICIVASEQEIREIQEYSFIDTILIVRNIQQEKKQKKKNDLKYSKKGYGNSYQQLHIHNGELLHDSGFDGRGMKVAIFDAGFFNVDRFTCFKHLFDSSKIHVVRNLVYNNDSVFSYDGHGTSVLGCMASYLKDTIVGTCPKADYYLFITEDSRSESRVEEFNWAIAAQKADSIGVDIINSSLGYSEFDDASMNYTYRDMDGETTIVSKAAKIATEKGILVVNSAGNAGDKPWHYISAPADVEQVITVGAIDNEGNMTRFSSRGWNSKNIVKPNVVAVGAGATVYYNDGTYFSSNGTSFSSPIMAGMIACLWQKFKHKDATTIKNLLYKSAHLYTSPSKDFGFGIPDFKKAIQLVSANNINLDQLKIYPNPTSDFIHIEYVATQDVEIQFELYNLQGKLISTILGFKNGLNSRYFEVKDFARGFYVAKFSSSNLKVERKILLE